MGERHPLVATSTIGLARIRIEQDQYDEAEPLLHEALSIREEALPAHHPDRIEAATMLGACLTMLERYDEAEALLVDAHEQLTAHPPEDGETLTQQTLQRLVELYDAWEKPNYRSEYASLLAEAEAS